MKDKRVTLSDIARELGVSINTVSHALNGKKDISEKTRKRVSEKAMELGYIRNDSASLMRSGKSKCISVIVGDISNPHFSILIKEIEMTAKENGYAVLVLNTNEDEEIEREAIVTSIGKNVDGIIICPVQKSKSNIEFLIHTGTPFTLIGRRFSDIDTNYVICDDRHSGYLAAEKLIKKGHRSIAVFAAPEYISSSAERLEGIREAYEENKLNLNLEDVFELPVTMGNHKDDIISCLSKKDYTAVICFSDLMALEVVCAIGDGKSDIVSFDNIRSKFSIPASFESITSSKTKMSNSAFEILLENINNPMAEKKHVVLTTNFDLSGR